MRIGWIGTGIMGAPMAGHLQAAGHELFVFNRTRAKAQDLLSRGAVWCDNPAAVAGRTEVVFTMVGFPADVEATYLGPDGVLAGNGPRLVIDMTTSQPSLAKRIHAAAKAKGIGSLDAPVSGGDVGARSAKLAIMVGGDPSDFGAALPLFQRLGETIKLMGGPGAGQHTKLCNQIVIAGTMIGVCESLLYAGRQGLNEAAVIDIIGKGAASSWSLNTLGPRIARSDFNPGFMVEHFLKDLGIALDECRAIGLALPGLTLAQQLYAAAQTQGHGRLGTQALMLALRRLNRM